MYIVIVGNEIVHWAKTFKQAHKEALNYERLHEKFNVWIAKCIVKDGVIIDK